MSSSTSPGSGDFELSRSTVSDSLRTTDEPASMSIEEIEALLETARNNITSPVTPVETLLKPPHSNGLTLEDLGDVDLDISIELGRTELLIEEVLKLREGSVVSLDQRAGDPVDIVANGRLIARGELLVVDGKFGVRLSEVL